MPRAQSCILLTCLPDVESPATERVLASFGAETEVNFSGCLYQEGYTQPPSCYVVRSQETGSRTTVNFNELPDMTSERISSRSLIVSEHEGAAGFISSEG